MKSVLEKAFISTMKKVWNNICAEIMLNLKLHGSLRVTLFLSDNKIVGDKISLGFFNNETDWSLEKEERVGSKTNWFKKIAVYFLKASNKFIIDPQKILILMCVYWFLYSFFASWICFVHFYVLLFSSIYHVNY